MLYAKSVPYELEAALKTYFPGGDLAPPIRPNFVPGYLSYVRFFFFFPLLPEIG